MYIICVHVYIDNTIKTLEGNMVLKIGHDMDNGLCT
jgi:hypothetical protein